MTPGKNDISAPELPTNSFSPERGTDWRSPTGDNLAREYASSMTENPLNFGEVVGDHQVITRAGQVEAVMVPLDEYRALKALEQREAELYWAVHEARYPSRPGDHVPESRAYESMDALLADLDVTGLAERPLVRPAEVMATVNGCDTVSGGQWPLPEAGQVDLDREWHGGLDLPGEYLAVPVMPARRVVQVGVHDRDACRGQLNAPVEGDARACVLVELHDPVGGLRAR